MIGLTVGLGQTRAEAIESMRRQWTAHLEQAQAGLVEGQRLIALAASTSAVSSLGSVRVFQAPSSRGVLRWVARLEGANGEQWTGTGKSRGAALADLRRTWDRHCAPTVKHARDSLAWLVQSIAQLDDGDGTGLHVGEEGGFLYIGGTA